MGWSGGCFLIRGLWSRIVGSRAAKEVERTSPSSVPGGTSMGGWFSVYLSRRLSGRTDPVGLAGDPNPKQHDCELASKRDLRLTEPASLRDTNRP